MLVPSRYAKALALKKAFNSLDIPNVLVDSGCGDGFYLQQIEAGRKIGLDLIPPESGKGIKYIKSDVSSTPLNDRDCDCLLSLDVIEHIDEDDRALDEFYRVLNDDGILVITTPNNSEFMPYRLFRVMFRLDIAKMHRVWKHVRPGYSKEELVALIKRHDFEVMSHRSIYQPLSRVFELVYIIPMMISERVYSPEERARWLRKRKGFLLRTLEGLHDFLFRLILGPIIKRIENTQDNGFFHLIICKKATCDKR